MDQAKLKGLLPKHFTESRRQEFKQFFKLALLKKYCDGQSSWDSQTNIYDVDILQFFKWLDYWF